MAKSKKDVAGDYSDFNPNADFAILFNLRFSSSKLFDRFGLLTMVWLAPVLPQAGDIIHVGRMPYDMVIRIDPKRKWDRCVVWYEGCTAIDAELLHVKTPKEYLDRLAGLRTFPEYRSRLRGSLHIMASVALEMEELQHQQDG